MASSKREKELARLRAERQVARRAAEAARRRRRNSIVASTLAVLAVAAVVVFISVRTGRTPADPTAAAAPSATGTVQPSPTAASPTPASPTAAAAPGTCVYTPAGTASRKVTPPPARPTVQGTVTATMATNQGRIVVNLLADKAPCAAGSIVSLAAQKYFDNTPCHRLTTEGIFVLQCGDPTGTGTGGPGYQFQEENLEGATYGRGTVAMAKSSAPGSTGSQFFLVYKDSQLPPEYTVVGKITAGLDVLDKIAKAGAAAADPNGNTAPKLKTTITSLRTSR